MYEEITSTNFIMYAIKHYENPQCAGEKEFHDDMKRFKYIKRLLKKYKRSGDLKERLLLNHIIILRNLFGNEACVTLLLFKTQKEYLGTLKSFLIFLNMIREDELIEISLDDYALEILRKI
jgi:small nuclear ribonucleoprotein (snRNP)-like protein